MNIDRRSRIPADNAVEEIYHFAEKSDCKSYTENNKHLANDHLNLFNGNEDNFIYKEIFIENKLKKKMNVKKKMKKGRKDIENSKQLRA